MKSNPPKLGNIGNLKAQKSSDNKKVTLTWSGIKTPNAINLEYLRSYFGSVYHAEEYAENDAIGRYNYNLEVLGKPACLFIFFKSS